MTVCLDTNIYTALAKGEIPARDVVRAATVVVLTFVTLAELRAGFRSGRQTAKNENALQRFLGETRVKTLYPDEQTTHHYGHLYAQLRSRGTPIPLHDLWIAALVLQHDLVLCTRDSHFDHLPQLPRIVA